MATKFIGSDGVKLEAFVEDPVGASDGTIYYNSTTKNVKAKTNGVWSDVSQAGGSVTSNKIENISALSRDLTRSFTSNSYPITRYGGAFFYPSDDGTTLFFTYSDYDYHIYKWGTLTTPWDFSTLSGVSQTGSINLSNHYQQTLYIMPDGLRLYTGGYTNAYGSGNFDMYSATMTTAWNPSSLSWATFGSNPRTAYSNHTGVKFLNYNEDDHTYIMSNNVPNTSSSENSSIGYVRKYQTSTDYNLNSSTQLQELDIPTLFNLGAHYSGGTGWTYHSMCMNRQGTQILVAAQYYASSTITSRRIYTLNLATPYDITSGEAIDANNYLDITSDTSAFNQGFYDIKYGKDDKEIVVQYATGSSGTANGVYGQWHVYS